MHIKTKAIVLTALKYQEKSLIVKCFTQDFGIKSYFVPSITSSKNNRKIAYFQPLTLLEIEAVHKNKGTLEYFKEIKIATPYNTITTTIVKTTIALFLSEVLHNTIREEEKNEPLFLFLQNAFLWLDNHEQISNFHLILLLEMTKYLGFYPDISQIDFPYFDKVEGNFSLLYGMNSLQESDSKVFKKLIQLEFNTSQKTFSVSERQLLLKIIFDYYAIHLDGFKKPKSLEILKEVFS